MVLAFSTRHPNATKAMNNWERKSSYLLREIVKFRTYIDVLTLAGEARKAVMDKRVEDEREKRVEEVTKGEAKDEEAAKGEVSEAKGLEKIDGVKVAT